jgi:NADH:ubiquinone oxidoreductase subunit 6 (subunit J)
LHADFLGAAQLLIYVGGTVVLLVFGVMLTASGPYSQIRTSPAEGILGAAVGGLLLFVLVTSIHGVDWLKVSASLPLEPSTPALADAGAHSKEAEQDIQQGHTVRQLGLSFIGVRTDRKQQVDGKAGLAPGYLLPFEIISVHLLVVLIGAAYLARAKRRIAPVDNSRLT